MKLAIIGATGNIGSRILDEALSRGHEATGLTRDAARLPPRPGLTPRVADNGDVEALAAALSGNEAVIVAVKWNENDIETVVEAVRRSGVDRCLIVVGAGSLRRPDGQLHFDYMKAQGFEPPTSKAAMAALDHLRTVEDLQWTALSPAARIEPGERTGRFRLGLDTLIVDDKGDSAISTEDFAVAILDEIERPAHLRQRFTLGY